ncbi:Zinc carboxypeptidase A 1 [Caenorhabditis elegans]|uniref:Zinc carboxypeptidase A 1 n=1 Tax=Caenorhabditis elegans TaxID=6239 RepID=H2L0D7_CAEEL|nr:ShKT domain-containing protein [Caenorhabditis elegans]CCD72562.2 ShKT domain-containing protein [Caenorhabditis elegans]|eukprot:NP_001021762.2 Uncharacterized protein CELE_Y47G6A.19 [Caenorhabditis elegans]
MILRVILALLIAVHSSCQEHGAFKVFRVLPTTNQQLLQMIRLFETADTDRADFWHAPSVVNGTVDIMVAPEHTDQFRQYLEKHGYTFQVAIDDLHKLLIEKEGNLSTHSNDDAFFLKRLHDDVGFHSRLRMGEYYSYSVLSTWLERIAENMPDIAKLIKVGTTIEGRDILGLKFGKDTPDKKIVVIDAGIHAREWAAIHTASYFINLIVNGREEDPQIQNYLDNIVLYIIPVLNPDGYEYTRTDKTNPRARMWRKSRSPKACAFDGVRNSCCMGVDLNRNFDFRFSEIGASRYPCSEIYHGPSAFSEPESKAYSQFLTSLKGRLEAYITLHSYSQLWIYSYSHRKFTYAPDIEETRRVAAKAVQELGRMYGTKYRHGTGPEIIYAFSGGSTDWAKETLKIKYSYTIELRPGYEEWNGFVLDKNQLIPTAKETWAGVTVVLDEVTNQWKSSRVRESELSRLRQEKCSDRLPGCAYWLQSSPNICRFSQSTMVRDCAKTCNLCHMIAV